MKALAYSMNILAILVTLGIGFLNLESFSFGAVGYLLAVITPYLFALWLTKWSKNEIVTLITVGLSSILALGGVYLLIDAMYVHPDAQSALVFPVVAVYQWAILLVVSIPLYFLNKRV